MKNGLVLLLILAFFSCKKDENVTISGVVKDIVVLSPVSGATVTLSAQKIESGTLNSQFSVIESKATSGDGSFSFTFEDIRVNQYKLTFYKNGYFQSERLINPENVVKGEDYSASYTMGQRSWLQVQVKNVAPVHAEDFLMYRIINGTVSGCGSCTDSMNYFQGASVDVVRFCELPAGQYAKIEWIFTYLQNSSSHKDSVYCQPGDTAIIVINY